MSIGRNESDRWANHCHWSGRVKESTSALQRWLHLRQWEERGAENMALAAEDMTQGIEEIVPHVRQPTTLVPR